MGGNVSEEAIPGSEPMIGTLNPSPFVVSPGIQSPVFSPLKTEEQQLLDPKPARGLIDVNLGGEKIYYYSMRKDTQEIKKSRLAWCCDNDFTKNIGRCCSSISGAFTNCAGWGSRFFGKCKKGCLDKLNIKVVDNQFFRYAYKDEGILKLY